MRTLIICTVLLCLSVTSAHALDGEPLLFDRNGDGIVSYAGFGDSVTFGVGDGLLPGEFVVSAPSSDGSGGYITRIRRNLGIAVHNAGVPGERFVAQGIARFPGTLFTLKPDIIGVLEGVNDAIDQVSSLEHALAVQRAINTARALGTEPVLIMIPPTCCIHSGPQFWTGVYNHEARILADINDVETADLELTWFTTCTDPAACDLYNLPEGLHPNTRGYDAIAQTVTATLLGIDIFAGNGAAELAAALGIPEETVIVRSTDG